MAGLFAMTIARSHGFCYGGVGDNRGFLRLIYSLDFLRSAEKSSPGHPIFVLKVKVSNKTCVGIFLL